MKKEILAVVFFFLPLLCFGRELKGPAQEKEPVLTFEEAKLKSLYNSLDPLSLTQQMAFYELYHDTAYGEKAWKRAWQLLSGGKTVEGEAPLSFPKFDLKAVVSLVTRQSYDPPSELSPEQFSLIDRLSSSLANRKLKGHYVWEEGEVLSLTPEEIDLSRALLINQFEKENNRVHRIRQYEANLDLMALQIRARLSSNPSSEEKIREINRYIFQEMQFRFPPHSLYAKDIDLYTFLPAVLDSRQGVCLGVSILYLCLAQRLDLTLEIITPPGHIFLRYAPQNEVLNIETTARGIHLPDDTYLGINTRNLERKNMKEVVGLAFVNQASVFWAKNEFASTVALYEKAQKYLPGDPLLKLFLGLNYLFVGKKKEGKKLLEEIQNHTHDYEVSKDTLAEDYLKGKVDAEGLKMVFLPVDENRTSIVEKQKQLEKMLSKYPHFRAGLLQLATCWLQLGRGNEALEVLKRYHKIDSNCCIVEYYLSLVSIQRMDYLQAWDFFRSTEKITQSRNHYPKALKALRSQLRHNCPEP